jgi:hypothetical protein
MAVQVVVTLDKDKVEQKQQEIIEKARVLLEKVIAHARFRSEVEGAVYSGALSFVKRPAKWSGNLQLMSPTS